MSDTQTNILRLLSDGEFHSGESLGKQLGCSRAAVWKHLQKLEAAGLELDSVKGTGYRIMGGLDLLEEQKLRAGFSQDVSNSIRELQVFQHIDSTNKFARELAERQAATGTVILAEQQSAGRGRRGKVWISPFAANIYLSIIWDFNDGAQALQGLSLAVGVAVKRALSDYGLQSVQLKWPNDIYVDNKKLGGILLEMIGDPVGHCSVIIGVGLNVSMPAKSGSRIEQEWTDIATLLKENRPSGEPLKTPSRNRLAAALISEIILLLGAFESRGFAAYCDEWQAADAFYNQQATISTAKESINGVVKGVDKDGALRLQLSDGRVERFIGGELSLRLAK